jgi:DNA polymerase epsilon subunit 1
MPLKPNRGGPSRGGGSNTRFTGKRGGGSSRGKGRGGGVAYGIDRPAPQREDDGTAAAEKFEEVRVWDEIDTKLGFERFESGRASGEEKVGWMVNMHQVGQASRARDIGAKADSSDTPYVRIQPGRYSCCRFLLYPR